MDRDSVGRSYYAMFHAAQAVLVTHGLQARTHKGTIHIIHDRFSGPEDFPPDLVAAPARTQKLREAADYDAVFSVGPSDAPEAIELAHRLILCASTSWAEQATETGIEDDTPSAKPLVGQLKPAATQRPGQRLSSKPTISKTATSSTMDSSTAVQSSSTDSGVPRSALVASRSTFASATSPILRRRSAVSHRGLLP